jgi:transglutaminase-like putative cysteine protease
VARPVSAVLPDRGVRLVMAVLAGIILSASAGHAPSIRLDRSTPAWTRVTQEIRAQGMGNCYHAALTLAMNARALGLENVSVIEGTLMGEGSLQGVRFGHSWVEASVPGQTTRVVLDYSSGNSLVMDRTAYHVLHQVQDVHEYSVSEARSLAANGNYGPWTADVLSAWHP